MPTNDDAPTIGPDAYNAEFNLIDDNIRAQIKALTEAYRKFRAGGVEGLDGEGLLIELDNLLDLLILTGRWEIIQIERLNDELAYLYSQLDGGKMPSDIVQFIIDFKQYRQNLFWQIKERYLYNRPAEEQSRNIFAQLLKTAMSEEVKPSVETSLDDSSPKGHKKAKR